MMNSNADVAISLILAVAENGAIGLENKIPWRIPSDLRNFMKLTSGHPVIMGRKTWGSLPKKHRPLSDRTNIVLTRESDHAADGARVVTRLCDAINEASQAAGGDNIFVIGGAEIYKLFMPIASRIYLTTVHASVAGDTFFSIDFNDWECVSYFPPGLADPEDQFPTSFSLLERKRK